MTTPPARRGGYAGVVVAGSRHHFSCKLLRQSSSFCIHHPPVVPAGQLMLLCLKGRQKQSPDIDNPGSGLHDAAGKRVNLSFLSNGRSAERRDQTESMQKVFTSPLPAASQGPLRPHLRLPERIFQPFIPRQVAVQKW